MINETTEGQTMELDWVENNKWNVSERDYFTMVTKKTAWYTCIVPMRVGGLIAGAPKKELNAMIEFGTALGRAFQIQDDVLNLVAKKKDYGKEIAGDIWEGKRTLILIHLLENCSKQEKKKVLKVMGKDRQEKTREEVKYVLGLMKKHGSIEYAKARSLKEASKAKRLFKTKFKRMKQNDSRKAIQGVIDFVVERKL
jgi:geranylgeranyl diphosphate synthase type II